MLNVIDITAANDINTDPMLMFKDSSNKPNPCNEQLSKKKEKLK